MLGVSLIVLMFSWITVLRVAVRARRLLAYYRASLSSIPEDVFSRFILCKCKKRLPLSNMLRFGARASPPCYRLRVSQLIIRFVPIRFVRSNYSFVICLRSECLTRCRSVVQLPNCSFVYSILILSLMLLEGLYPLVYIYG